MVSARSIILAGATCLMLGGAAPATAAETIAATTASDGVIQVTGTSLADTVTVLRREGTRFVRITGNRPVTAGTGCQALSSTQVECVPRRSASTRSSRPWESSSSGRRCSSA